LKKRTIVTALVSMLLVVTVFVAGAGAAFAAPGGKYRDTIIYSPNTDVLTLDPQFQNDTTSEQLVRMLYHTLLKFEDDGTIVGDIANEWKVAENGTTWTIKLKKGVKFHSGKEVTASDVKATYERAMKANGGGLKTTEIIKMFTSVEALDKYTVVIKTDKPYGPMEALLCNLSLGVMDSEYIDKYGLDLGANVKAENGTGPYKIVSWVGGDEIKLERFDDYFGGAAPTKNIIYRPIAEAAARVIALETGEVDVISGINADDIPTLESNPKINILKSPSVGQRLFRFGCNDPIIGNTMVRQAIVYAIDRQIIIDSMFTGTAYPSTAPLAPVTWGYKNLGEIKRDVDKAKALLAKAGYPDGFATKIVTAERYAKGVQLAEVLASQLAEVGIKATIDVWEWSALSASWNGSTPEEFNQPIFVMGAGPSMRDADGGLRGLYTTSESGKNDRNYGFYSNTEVDKLILAGMSETNMKERAKLYARAEQILYLEDPVAIWLFDIYGMCATSDKVEDVTLSPLVNITFEKAKIKK
jgi:peptide/nickel transport system substrate-binding protein